MDDIRLTKQYGQGELPIGLIAVEYSELKEGLGLPESCQVLDIIPGHPVRWGRFLVKVVQSGYLKTPEGADIVITPLDRFKEEFGRGFR